MKSIIKYRLIDLGNNCYDFSMEPITIQFKNKAQAKLFWENLTKVTGSLIIAKQTNTEEK